MGDEGSTKHRNLKVSGADFQVVTVRGLNPALRFGLAVGWA